MAKKEKKTEKEVQRFSTGDPVLDCIFSNGEGMEQGYPIGKTIWLWGPSKSGKSALCVEALFWLLKKYGKENCDYLWLDVERAYSFDSLGRMGFSINDEKHMAYPVTVSEWQAMITNFVAKKDSGRPKIIILDSLDALTTVEELKRKEERAKTFKSTGSTEKKDKKGTYGMEKSKRVGEVLRTCTDLIAKNNVTMFVISQERANVNAGLFEKKTTVSGGKAPGFYSTVQLELKQVESFGDKWMEWGGCVQLHVQKSRSPFEGRRTLINVDWEQGYDPISSSIDFLYDLKDEYAKLDAKKIKTLKWEDEFNLESLDAEGISDADVKKFAGEKGATKEDLKEADYGNYTIKNIKAFIEDHPEIMEKFITEFGVMSRDALIKWVEEDESGERETELNRRTQLKFYEMERRSKPERKNRKTLG